MSRPSPPQYQFGPAQSYSPPGTVQPHGTQPPTTRRTRGSKRKIFGILLIVVGVLPVVAGAAVIGKTFSNSRLQMTNNAFAAVAWHNLRTDEIFPEHLIDTTVIEKHPQGWSRQGIAEATTCAEAFRADLAKFAAGQDCTTALRATYVDIGTEMAATIAIGVVGSYQQAQLVSEEFNWAKAPGPLVHPVAVAGTPASGWNDDLAMAGGAAGVGLTTNYPPYFAAITVGPLDATREYRTLPGEWKRSARDEPQVFHGVAADLVTLYARSFNEVVSK